MTSENDICLFTKAPARCEQKEMLHGCQIRLWRLPSHPLDGQMRFTNNQTTHLIPLFYCCSTVCPSKKFSLRLHPPCGMKINCKRLFYGEMRINSVEDKKHQRDRGDLLAGGMKMSERGRGGANIKLIKESGAAPRHEKPSPRINGMELAMYVLLCKKINLNEDKTRKAASERNMGK